MICRFDNNTVLMCIFVGTNIAAVSAVDYKISNMFLNSFLTVTRSVAFDTHLLYISSYNINSYDGFVLKLCNDIDWYVDKLYLYVMCYHVRTVDTRHNLTYMVAVYRVLIEHHRYYIHIYVYTLRSKRQFSIKF